MKQRFTRFVSLLACSALVLPASAAGSNALQQNYDSMKAALIALLAVSLAAIVICVLLTTSLIRAGKSRHGKMKRSFHILLVCSYSVAAVTLICTLVCGLRYRSVGESLKNPGTSATEPSSGTVSTAPAPSQSTEETEPQPTVPPTEPEPTLTPVMTEHSNPNNWGIKWDIIVNEKITDSYQRGEEIFFGDPNKNPYFSLPGIATFRGDNYRTGASYGTADIKSQTLNKVWNRKISSMLKPSGTSAWTGSGWTGQPVVVQWDKQTRENMNLYPDKKAKDGLVEVIYATLDGNIYFYDIDDGKYTRDPLHIGMAFKGAGALDPRGYPIMYVGSGDRTVEGKVPRMFIINLIDCSIMYQRGNDEPLKLRNWIAFDSSPLVDPETDTLIWPGESGLLYTIKLNSKYDPQAGTMSIQPETPVMTRYSNTTGQTYGAEDSSIIVGNYLYIADNGGQLTCVDLNTMKLIWAQHVKDDTNATMVFEWGEDGNGYLYTGSSLEFCKDTVYIYKINAANGEIVWEKTYDNVGTTAAVSGGILSSPVLGKKGTDLEGLVIYSISRTPSFGSGTLVALDTDTGKVVWEKTFNHYAWSSPVAVYTESQKGYLVLCDSGGNVHLLDGKSGKTLDTISVGANVEASPIVYNNRIIVGTRGQQVYALDIK